MTKRIWLHIVNSMRGGVGRVVQNLIAAGIDGFEQKISALDAGSFSPAGAALKKIITAKRAIGSLPQAR